jgi:hypothetical protein
MTSKACTRCGITKPLDAFYREGGRYRPDCKECARDQRNRYRRTEAGRAALRAQWAASEHRREKQREQARKWRQKNPAKVAAEDRLMSAIKTGRLIRRPCEVCGAANAHGHHADYAKPLEVQWLCPVHHAHQHVAAGRLGQAS